MNLSDISMTANPIRDPVEAVNQDTMVKPINDAEAKDKSVIEEVPTPLFDDELAQTLLETIDKVRQFAQLQSKNVDFSIERFDGLSVVVVSDSQTQEVLRQIPSEEMIEVSKKIEQLQTEILGASSGMLFDKKV